MLTILKLKVKKQKNYEKTRKKYKFLIASGCKQRMVC